MGACPFFLPCFWLDRNGVGLDEAAAFEAELAAAVAAEAELFLFDLGLSGDAVFDDDGDELGICLEGGDAEDGLAFAAEEGVEGDVGMAGIPQPAARGEIGEV